MFISKNELKDIQNRLGLLENLIPEFINEIEELEDELDDLEDEYLEVLFQDCPKPKAHKKTNTKTCKKSKSKASKK